MATKSVAGTVRITTSRDTVKTYANSTYTDFDNGRLVVARDGETVATFPPGSWAYAEVKES